MLLLISILLAIAAIFSWISARVLRLPNTIGIMLLMALTSIALELGANIWPSPHRHFVALLNQINFERLMLHGMLALLLFAGSFLLNIDALRRQALPVTLLSFIATVLSTLGVGVLTYGAAHLLGLKTSWLECMLFGALISPTDPIAVLEMLRRVGAPLHLEAQLAGESLFNDGVGAVIFIALLGATHGVAPSIPHIVAQIAVSAGGGLVLGVLLAWPVAWLIRGVENPVVHILLTLALAAGGYVLAEHLGVSAPLETVATGLMLRWLISSGPAAVESHDLSHFWTHLDEVQNALLFLLLGCGFLVVEFHRGAVELGLAEIVIVNCVRVGSVALVLLLLRGLGGRQASSITVLSWGGLRGGLSIALALSVPRNFGGGWILTATYVLVIFSVLVQGSTMGMLLRRLSLSEAIAPVAAAENV